MPVGTLGRQPQLADRNRQADVSGVFIELSSQLQPFAGLLLAGLACGLLWECWNYWAYPKWVYTVPVPPDVKLFEMPLAGYLGFPAFAVECFVMYVFVRRWLWRGSWRPAAL